MGLLITALWLVFSLFMASFAVPITRCHDGDTCTAIIRGKPQSIRFRSIDTPEITQPFGYQAKHRTESLLKGQDVTLACQHRKSGKRKVCSVYLNGQDVQAMLVQEGFAWDYREFSHGRYESYQVQAMQGKRGLWAYYDVTSPYCWRHPKKWQCQVNRMYQP